MPPCQCMPNLEAARNGRWAQERNTSCFVCFSPLPFPPECKSRSRLTKFVASIAYVHRVGSIARAYDFGAARKLIRIEHVNRQPREECDRSERRLRWSKRPTIRDREGRNRVAHSQARRSSASSNIRFLIARRGVASRSWLVIRRQCPSSSVSRA